MAQPDKGESHDRCRWNCEDPGPDDALDKPSLSALKRLAQPTPMMLVVIACVVLTGMPSVPVTASTVAAVVSAAKPCTGCSFTILWPSVLMIFHPPAAVPAAMVNAQAKTHQCGTAWLFASPTGGM